MQKQRDMRDSVTRDMAPYKETCHVTVKRDKSGVTGMSHAPDVNTVAADAANWIKCRRLRDDTDCSWHDRDTGSAPFGRSRHHGLDG